MPMQNDHSKHKIDGKNVSMNLRVVLLLSCFTVVFWLGDCRIKIELEYGDTNSCHHGKDHVMREKHNAILLFKSFGKIDTINS
jgi:hypothetical protein